MVVGACVDPSVGAAVVAVEEVVVPGCVDVGCCVVVCGVGCGVCCCVGCGVGCGVCC